MSSRKLSLEDRVAAIEERNLRVEEDKAWETSWVRRFSIATLTYLVVLVYLFAIGNSHAFRTFPSPQPVPDRLQASTPLST